MPELIDADYEKEVVKLVATLGLYRFGRFETAREGQVCLGWVDIQRLCCLGLALDGVVMAMDSWVRRKLQREDEEDPSQVVFVGLDVWGSILGSQVAVRSRAPFIPLSFRRQDGELHPEELDATALEALQTSRAVVIVTDVVGTGRSLALVRDWVQKLLGEEAAKIRWHGVSLICDSDQERGDQLAFLEAHGTICRNLRMPLVDERSLPETSVYPAQLSYL